MSTQTPRNAEPTPEQLVGEKALLVARKQVINARLAELKAILLHKRLPVGTFRACTDEKKELTQEIGQIDQRLFVINPAIKAYNVARSASQKDRDYSRDRLIRRNRLLFAIAQTAEHYLYAETDLDDERYGDRLESLFGELAAMIPDWNERDPDNFEP